MTSTVLFSNMIKFFKNRLRRNDIILILTLLLIASIGAVYLFFFREEGNTVVVTIDGKNYGVYSLNENLTKDIYSGEDDKDFNRLIIRDGKAYIESASCPDGICVNHKPIFRQGESIVCLPNGVVVTVIESDSSDDVDIIV